MSARDSALIDIKGLDKAAVLAALYNAAKPVGMGHLHLDTAPMTVDQARRILEQSRRFDYLKGRVMKVILDSDELDPRLYDRDNGAGAAARVIERLEKDQKP